MPIFQMVACMFGTFGLHDVRAQREREREFFLDPICSNLHLLGSKWNEEGQKIYPSSFNPHVWKFWSKIGANLPHIFTPFTSQPKHGPCVMAFLSMDTSN